MGTTCFAASRTVFPEDNANNWAATRSGREELLRAEGVKRAKYVHIEPIRSFWYDDVWSNV